MPSFEEKFAEEDIEIPVEESKEDFE